MTEDATPPISEQNTAPIVPPQNACLAADYKLFLEDDLAQAIFYRETYRLGRRDLIGKVILTLVIGLFVALVAGELWYVPIAIGSVLVAGFLVYDDVAGYQRRVAAALQNAPNLHLGVPMRVTVGPKGVVCATGLAKEYYLWQRIGRVVQTAEHIFIYLGIAHAIIIPRRAFDSDDAFDHFFETTRSHKAKAPKLPDEQTLSSLEPLLVDDKDVS